MVKFVFTSIVRQIAELLDGDQVGEGTHIFPNDILKFVKGTRIWIAVLAIGVSVGAGALSMRRKPVVPPLPAARVEITSEAELTLSGTIRAQHVTTITSAVAGNVEAVMVNTGDEVFQGEVLARIGSAGLESEQESAAHAVEYAQEKMTKAEAAVNPARMESSRASAETERARMALERAEKNYSRQKMLNEVGATPRLTYEKAGREYQAAQQEAAAAENAASTAAASIQSALDEVEAAKKVLAEETGKLEQARQAFEIDQVRSPVDGLVVERNAEPGKFVQDLGGDLFQIAADLYALEVVVQPPPATFNGLKPGQPALVIIPDLQASGIPGTVKQISGTQVIVEFTSTFPAILPGMRAHVRLKLE